MAFNLFTKIFGSSNDRIIKQLQPIVNQINDLEPGMQKLTDEDDQIIKILEAHEDKKHLVVLNKSDLGQVVKEDDLDGRCDEKLPVHLKSNFGGELGKSDRFN